MATGLPVSTSVSNWNRSVAHVEAAVRSGRFVNAETTLIVAGPPRISDLSIVNGLSTNINSVGQVTTDVLNSGAGGNGADALYPLGMVESLGVQQVQAVQKMFEIGARRSYQAAGRVQVSAALGRVMFHGPSLLRSLMAYYPNNIQMARGRVLGASSGGQKDSILESIATAGGSNQIATGIFPEIYFEPGSFASNDPEKPGSMPAAFMMNLMSELFSHPFGLGVIMRDNANKNYGAIYLEDCFVNSHSFQISASSTLISESVNLTADACVPVEFSTEAGALISSLSNI